MDKKYLLAQMRLLSVAEAEILKEPTA